MIKAIIFDMDGLMIDSERITFECYQEILKEMGLTMSKSFYISLLGKPIPGIQTSFYEEYGEDFPINEVIKACHELMAERFKKEGIPIKKGLISLLDYLKEHDYKTIVATSSTRDRVDSILSQAHLTKYFDASICGDEVTHGKPNPEVFIKSCEKLNVSREEAIVLEDSEAGILAAFDAHIPVICIPDMKYPEPYFAKKTTRILSSLDEVISFLK